MNDPTHAAAWRRQVLGCPELLTFGSKGHENCHRRAAERHRHVAVGGVTEVPRGETPEALDMLSIEAIARWRGAPERRRTDCVEGPLEKRQIRSARSAESLSLGTFRTSNMSSYQHLWQPSARRYP